MFDPAPSYRLDGNAKARLWTAAGAYNSANRQPRQHQGPLTWAMLRVLRALLWRFHNADTSNGYQLLTRWSANPSRIASKSANRRIDELQASLTEERHRINSRGRPWIVRGSRRWSATAVLRPTDNAGSGERGVERRQASFGETRCGAGVGG